MPSVNYGGPKLLQALLNQVERSRVRKRNAGYGRNASSNRKDQRKLDSEQKRVQRRQPRPKNPLLSTQKQHSTSESNVVRAPQKFASAPKPSANTTFNPLESIVKTSSKHNFDARGRADEAFDPSLHVWPRPKQNFREKLADDDTEIAALEKRLGIKSTRKLPKSFEDDGLDDLLKGLDSKNDIYDETNGKRKEAGQDDQDWLKLKRRKVQAVHYVEADIHNEDRDMDSDEEKHSFEDQLFGKGESEGSTNKFVRQTLQVEDHRRNGDGNGFESIESHAMEEQLQPRVRENPYIAPGTNQRQPATKYLPPFLRVVSSGDAEANHHLRRETQGLLNRLSEANLLSILREVKQLYQDNPRMSVTSTLIDLLLASLCIKSIATDTFIILHTGFIASLYKVIGLDFGAHVVESIVQKFDHHYNNKSSKQETGKELINLISLLAQLYNLQVISCEIIFDYIRSFLGHLTELHTELLLLLIKSSGFQLRRDDPTSLKDIVMMLQNTIAEVGVGSLSVRTKFMVETIENLKNNKMTAGAATSAITSEHLVRMRRTLGSLNTRSIKASEPLRLNLEDIRDKDKKGKWWLMGAGWNRTDGKKEAEKTTKYPVWPASSQDMPEDPDAPNSDLLQLAKEQRMNTDIRRTIFVTIMAASDHKDAHVRLRKLNLTRTQELEIPRVLLHCAGTEERYNPYYTLISRRLCGEHKLQKAFQFALWDFFKVLGDRTDDCGADHRDEDGQIAPSMLVNHAKFFGYLVATAASGIGILKNLDLAYLRPQTKTFVEILLVTVILQCKKQNASNLTTVFRVARDFPQLVAGLQYFLRKVVMKTNLVKDGAEQVVVKAGCNTILDYFTTLTTEDVGEA